MSPHAKAPQALARPALWARMAAGQLSSPRLARPLESAARPLQAQGATWAGPAPLRSVAA